MKPKLTALFLAALMLAGCTPTGSSSDTTDSVLTDTPTAEATEAPTETYTQEAVRNNITEVRVTNDAENLYFYIKCEADIVVSDDAGWMNLFIGTGSSPTVKGWESYEFAINRAATAVPLPLRS